LLKILKYLVILFQINEIIKFIIFPIHASFQDEILKNHIILIYLPILIITIVTRINNAIININNPTINENTAVDNIYHQLSQCI